jgi:general secretion pathway protein E
VLARTGDEAEHTVEVLVCGATAPAAIAEVSRRFGRIACAAWTRADLEAAIAGAYAGSGGDASQVADEFDADLDLTKLLQDVPAIEDLLESSDDAPVIRMINALLTQALREGASDIHIEPFEQTSVVRFRIDGALRDIVRPRKAIHASLISRIKIMAQLDIAEKRLPQDGRITLRIGGKPVDVRVSTLPTGHGERAVLRLLDKEAGRLDLPPRHERNDAAAVRHLINQPHGIVLVTGPTGSGKTTTLYAALSRLNAATTNILTVEDPIEYDLNGVGQTQVNAAHRHDLRQGPARDPAPGPGRDHDRRDPRPGNRADRGAGIADRPPGAGDAAHQRRRRRRHPFARHGHRTVPAVVVAAGRDGAAPGAQAVRAHAKPRRRTGHAVGCDKCGHTGYHGRVGVYELLRDHRADPRADPQPRVRSRHPQAAASKTACDHARRRRTLAGDGTTTQAELLRVTKD